MAVHIIIDGYNLIRQSDRFSLVRQDLQAARRKLVDTLRAYQRIKPHKITVVFDGAEADFDLPRSESRGGIHVRFSRKGEQADNVIKRMASRERERALVVSSDRDIVHFATLQGSATIGSPQFEEIVSFAAAAGQEAIPDPEDRPGWVPTTKKKGPTRRRSKKERRIRTKIEKL